MKNENKRVLKVYNQSQGDKGNIPTIILKGEWLRDPGFNCNDKIEVLCEKNKITIMKTDKD